MEQESTIKWTAEGQIDYDQLAEALVGDNDLAIPDDMYDEIEVRQLNAAIARVADRHQFNTQVAEMWASFENLDQYGRGHRFGTPVPVMSMKPILAAMAIMGMIVGMVALVVWLVR